MPPAIRRSPIRRRQLLLSAPFVFGCAFRSVFPRADVQRICVIDSWLSAVALGRTVAMIAELCFAAQCALLLRVLAVEARKPVALAISRVMVPLIAMAEIVLLVFGDHDELHRQHDGGVELGDRRAAA